MLYNYLSWISGNKVGVGVGGWKSVGTRSIVINLRANQYVDTKVYYFCLYHETIGIKSLLGSILWNNDIAIATKVHWSAPYFKSIESLVQFSWILDKDLLAT